MNTSDKSASKLREEIAKTEARLQDLKTQLAQLEAEGDGRPATAVNNHPPIPKHNGDDVAAWKWPLSAAEYERYGRQLILPQVGIEGLPTQPLVSTRSHTDTIPTGQKKLKSAKILIIGAGGLGCPAVAYLAGAGVGTLGIVDGDVVEPSNLHRQIAHGTSRVGHFKVDSLVTYCQEYVDSLIHYLGLTAFLN